MLTTMGSLPKNCKLSQMSSPVGELCIIASSQGLHAILWENDLMESECKDIIQSLAYSETHTMMKLARKQLHEYFTGKRSYFSIPLVMVGTAFQKKAWEQLLTIPYGETISYGEQAKRLGDSKKARAVGVANSKNPISIIVPCHRVIAKNGDLTGFAGGLENKKFLIELEANSKCVSR
jgi:methylated-DNA-[protein]-cysteine S-methyltransferase